MGADGYESREDGYAREVSNGKFAIVIHIVIIECLLAKVNAWCYTQITTKQFGKNPMFYVSALQSFEYKIE